MKFYFLWEGGIQCRVTWFHDLCINPWLLLFGLYSILVMEEMRTSAVQENDGVIEESKKTSKKIPAGKKTTSVKSKRGMVVCKKKFPPGSRIPHEPLQALQAFAKAKYVREVFTSHFEV